MAARDRFGGFAEPPSTPLQRYIQNACDPQNYEPNLALDLEISDLINSKKGNAPREAAFTIVSYINHRNPNVSQLALTLLDICVKNCGYPFHLQISTKEFLNDLVRRFPERPPIRCTRVQNKILELIEEWRQTICETSKYKEDLGFIRDMHRLLKYKGYDFPQVKREDAAVLNPSDNLKSAEEMEEEERAAQSAKLQELIRRGTPNDLQEANKLMKVMAGYDNRHKTDYRAKAAEEVGKVQQKARMLEEMLQQHSPGNDNINNETCEELASALANAHPKIQKMCEEESDDTEAVAKLFEINDSINRTLERYKLIKKGDTAAAAQIPRGTLGSTGAGVKRGPNNELSLIDFGPEDSPSQPEDSNNNAGGATSLENDLLGLSVGERSSSTQPGISLGPSDGTAGSSQQQHGNKSSTQDIMAMFNSPASSMVQQPPKQTLDIFSSPAPYQQPPPQSSISTPPTRQPQPPAQPQPQSAALDPFAALTASSQQRTASPSQAQSRMSANASPSLGNFSSNTPAHNNSSSVPAPADDEWTFTSALPSDNDLTVTNGNMNVRWRISRSTSNQADIVIHSTFSNNLHQPITDLEFLVAAPRTVQLRLQPQSGRMLGPKQSNGITQDIVLSNIEHGKGHGVKVRWKASYKAGGQPTQEQGEVASLGVD